MSKHDLTITVDARSIFDSPRRGIAKVTIASYRALAALRPNWRFVLFHRLRAEDNPFDGRPNIACTRIEIQGDKYRLWERLRLPAANLLAGADLFHAPAGVAPARPLAPLVATIHDLIPMDLRPDAPDVIVWAASVRRAARNARRILTASQFSRDRIASCFGEPPSKIDLVTWASFNGTAAEPVAPGRVGEVRAAYGLDPAVRYVLHFGMADPRKNTLHTIEAWARVPPAARRDRALLVIGVEGPALDLFRARISQLGLSSSAFAHGYAPEEDVNALLAGADVLCYPTTYEGFGLPILDGFAAGVCVVTGNATSLPEVAGDAAVLVDAGSADAIAEGLTAVLTDEALRQRLIERGRRRGADYTWTRTAEQMARTFEAVVGQGRRQAGTRRAADGYRAAGGGAP